MGKRKKDIPRWEYALAAIVGVACALVGTWTMFHRERLDGLDVMQILVWWALAVTWSVRAVLAFRGRGSDKKTTEDDNMIDGGTIHD